MVDDSTEFEVLLPRVFLPVVEMGTLQVRVGTVEVGCISFVQVVDVGDS